MSRVKTIDGRLIKEINAVNYNGNYYSKKDNCVKIGGRYYPFEHPDIAVDAETKEWNLISKMCKGVVGFDMSKNPVMGFFTPNESKNAPCYLNTGEKYLVLEAGIVPASYNEDPNKGIFYAPMMKSKGVFEIRTVVSHQEKGYNIEDNKDDYKEKIRTYSEYKEKIPFNLARYARFLGDITFGIENEVAVGSLPDRIMNQCGLVLCRDGSVESGEYVSIPMSGIKGVNNIRKIGEEMSKRTFTDYNCSYHVHIGNIETSRMFLLSLHKLMELTQDEMFTMLPYYKTFPKNIKRKDYCKKLNDLFPLYEKNRLITDFDKYVKYNYYRLYRYLTCTDQLPSRRTNRKLKVHPRGNRKWEIDSRYYCLNFINAIFSNRNTVEFRAFQNTTNPTKMITWLYICAAYVKFAEYYGKEILTKKKKYSLKDVVNIYKDLNPTSKDAAFLSDYLNDYIENRKKYFATLAMAGDVRADRDTNDDKNFKHFYQGKTII